MTTALEIAKYVLTESGRSMSGKRLQKLLYFCDAWHYTALDRALIPTSPEAWRHGPVYRDVWDRTKYSSFGLNPKSSLADVELPSLQDDSRQLIDSVLKFYARFTDDQLIELAHEGGSPWSQVYSVGQNNAISHEKMRQYYSRAIARNEARPSLPTTVYSYVLPEDIDEIEASLEDSSPAPGLVSMLVKAQSG